MSDTPRTDGASKWFHSIDGQMQIFLVSEEFAKRLERENNRLRAALVLIRDGDHEYPDSEWRIARDTLAELEAKP